MAAGHDWGLRPDPATDSDHLRRRVLGEGGLEKHPEGFSGKGGERGVAERRWAQLPWPLSPPQTVPGQAEAASDLPLSPRLPRKESINQLIHWAGTSVNVAPGLAASGGLMGTFALTGHLRRLLLHDVGHAHRPGSHRPGAPQGRQRRETRTMDMVRGGAAAPFPSDICRRPFLACPGLQPSLGDRCSRRPCRVAEASLSVSGSWSLMVCGRAQKPTGPFRVGAVGPVTS